MARDNRQSTPTRKNCATYDKLGWIRNVLEHAHRIVIGQYSPHHMKRAIRMTMRHHDYWSHTDSGKAEDWKHERAILGIEFQLFHETARQVVSLLSEINWHEMKEVTLDIRPLPHVRELLSSCSELPECPDGMIPVSVVLALVAVQTSIPGGSPLPALYYDLTRNSIDDWMINETEHRNELGTCEVTGKDEQTTWARKNNGQVLEVGVSVIREQKGWDIVKNFEVVAVKQLGLPMIATCPGCVLRRSNRPTEEDPNVPAFPFTKQYLDDNERILNIGNPIDAGARVLTMAYLKVFTTRDRRIVRAVRRQCPACMAVAIKDPAGYHAYIRELNTNRGRGPVTEEMIRAWRKETGGGADIRYQKEAEVEMALAADGSTVDSSGGLEKKAPKGAQLLRLAERLQLESPGLLNHVCTFTKGKARLIKGVGTMENLHDSLDAFDALEPEDNLPDVEKTSVQEEE